MNVSLSSLSSPVTVATATVLALLLGGCGSRNAIDEAAAPAGPTGPWFCESKPTGSGWDCTDDPQRVANPRPSQPLARVLAARDAAEAAAAAASAASAGLIDDALVQPSASTADQLGAGAAMAGAASSIATDAGPEAGNSRRLQVQEPLAGAPRNAATTADAAVSDAASDSVDPRGMDQPAYAKLAYRPDQPTSLLELPPDFYAVQLVALSSAAELQRFFDRLGVSELTAAEVEVDGTLRYVLLLGVYETFANAEQAATDLPEPIAAYDPWIRRLGGLQAAMLRADRRRQ